MPNALVVFVSLVMMLPSNRTDSAAGILRSCCRCAAPLPAASLNKLLQVWLKKIGAL